MSSTPEGIWRVVLTGDALRANAKWLARGRIGEGRLVVEGKDLRGLRVVGLAGARLVRCDLSHAGFPTAAQLHDIELVECRIEDGAFGLATFASASLDTCSFARSDMQLARLDAAHVLGCRFDGADLRRSSWVEAQVGGCAFVGANLTDASFTRALFERCDFRDARLMRIDLADHVASTTGARFRRCDFRGADFGGRSLAGATFEDCVMDGALPADARFPCVGSTAPEWIEVAGGTIVLGLTDDEARAFAELVATRTRRRVEEDPDPLHGLREADEVERMWGNPDHLFALLACSRPAHAVEVTSFAIATRPVTVAEYGEFTRDTGAAPPARWPHARPSPSDPVTGISWDDAAAYAAWRRAALPTEAQWEHVARGPDRSWFPFSDESGIAGGLYEWCADAFAPYPGAPRDACDAIRPPDDGWAGTRARRGGALVGFPPSAVTRRGAESSARLRDTTLRLVVRR